MARRCLPYEIKAPPGGYIIDTPSTNVVIGQGGDTQTVIVKNSKAGTLVIDKRDSVTNKPLAGVTFKKLFSIYLTAPERAIIAEPERVGADEKKLSE